MKVKLSLFTDDMIIHVENPKDFTKNLLVLINEVTKILEQKVNIQNPTVFLYTRNNHRVKLKHNVICNATRKQEILGIYLTKDVYDPYTEYYKTLEWEIKEDLTK